MYLLATPPKLEKIHINTVLKLDQNGNFNEFSIFIYLHITAHMVKIWTNKQKIQTIICHTVYSYCHWYNFEQCTIYNWYLKKSSGEYSFSEFLQQWRFKNRVYRDLFTSLLPQYILDEEEDGGQKMCFLQRPITPYLRAKHIHIIIISLREADNVRPNQVKLLVKKLGSKVTGLIKPPVIKRYNVLVYFARGLGLTNNILRNAIGRVFHHLPHRRWKEEYWRLNNLKE